MTNEELSISDATLIERLRDWPYQGETMAGEAADRIEQLVATNEALVKELAAANNEFGSQTSDWPDLWRRIAELKEGSNERWRRAERLEAALRGLMMHEPDHPDTLWQDARAALKGEDHE